MAQQEEQTPQQVEHELSELETRLERVRVLYEQYFMGIEKREPGVQRKDVDRRIAQLRRTRFNSTALRFKFQTTVQRYNTLMNYWNRTCREIENGTYRRHLKLAEMRRAELTASQPNQEEVKERAASAAEAKAKAAADLAAMLDDDTDLDAEMNDALASLDGPAKKEEPKAGALGKLGKAQSRNRGHTHPTLHLDQLKSKTETDKAGKGSTATRKTSTQPKPLDPVKKRSATSNKRSATSNKRSATANPLAALGKKSSEEKEPKKPAAKKPPPLKRSATGARPPTAPLRPPRADETKSPTAKEPPAKKPSIKKPADNDLSAERIKALHASYSDARKKTNASAVSFEKLEKNLREQEKKLRAKHKGRGVDFEVGIKNGKAILKPKLK